MSPVITPLISSIFTISLLALNANAETLKPISVTDTAIQGSNSAKPTTVETDVTTSPRWWYS